MNRVRSNIPVAFFSIPVGVLALANAWRVASRIRGFPIIAANMLTLIGIAIWLFLLAAYAVKWLHRRDEALAEFVDPTQSQFVALLPVSMLLASQAGLAYSHGLGVTLFALGAVGELAIGLRFQARLWRGGRQQELVTPAIYLPTVAPGFVAATTAATLGWPHIGAWFFGTGLLSWLAIESIILQRVTVGELMAAALRPTIGIQLAPPVVGGVAYIALTSGAPDLFAQLLFGYGLFQALLLLRLLPWVLEQPFAPGYWAFSFGAAALPTMAIRMEERGAGGALGYLAIALFLAANVVFVLLAVKTLQLLMRGRLLPVKPVLVAATN